MVTFCIPFLQLFRLFSHPTCAHLPNNGTEVLASTRYRETFRRSVSPSVEVFKCSLHCECVDFLFDLQQTQKPGTRDEQKQCSDCTSIAVERNRFFIFSFFGAWLSFHCCPWRWWLRSTICIDVTNCRRIRWAHLRYSRFMKEKKESEKKIAHNNNFFCRQSTEPNSRLVFLLASSSHFSFVPDKEIRVKDIFEWMKRIFGGAWFSSANVESTSIYSID